MADERMSEHFLLSEFTHSDTAKAKNISNNPNATQKKTIKHTCDYCLEPLRKLIIDMYSLKDAAITITSGFRSAKLNTAVGGCKTSQHRTGEAADIKVTLKYQNGNKQLLAYGTLYELIKMWTKQGKLSVDQCILEVSKNKKTGAETWWVHIGYKAAGATVNRREFLKYNNGTYKLDCKL